MDKVNVFKNNSTSISGRKVARLMGRKVMVSIAMQRRYDTVSKEDRWMEHLYKEPRPGWIVGARRVYDGNAVLIGYDEGREFHATRNTPVILVAHWPTEKPVHVYPNEASVRFWEEGDPEPFSSNWGDTIQQREANIQVMRKGMWAYPRDDKGRFRRCTDGELLELCRKHGY